MGCEASTQAEFNQPLDQELEHQLNFVSFNKKGEQVDRFQTNKPEEGTQGLFQATNQQAGQQFMAVKPWIGALVSPNNPPPFKTQAPSKNLKLTFINGFKVQDSRQNMFWGKNKDQIIYSAAAIGVVMNVNTLKQRYFGDGLKSQAKGFTDDILSLGVCPQRKLVVSGSIGAKPLIIVWNSDTMEVLSRTNLGRNTRAVSTIRFSRDGKLFFCSDKSNDSGVYCFQTASGTLLGTNKCGSDPIFDGEAGDHNTFAVATKRGMWFFQQVSGGLDKKKGIFGSNSMTPMITVTYNYDQKCFYSGTSTGQVYQWRGNSCSKSFKLHQGSVMGLNYAGGKLLSSGSKDNLIKISQGGSVIKQIQIPSYAKSLDLLNGNILAGTKGGQILSINQQSGQIKQIMQGHSTGETWGLCVADNGKVYTTADDNSVLQFNPKTFKVQNKGIVNKVAGKKNRILGASTLSMLPPNQHSRAVAVNKQGHVALGTNYGQLSIRKVSDLNTPIFHQKISKEWIQVIKYSPDEKRLAVGSHDNDIYIYSINGDTYNLQGKCEAHKSFITNMDWSRDGNYIQSNCGAYQYLFFDVNSKKQLKSGASQLKDQKWATYTVKLGWWVQGIFPPATDGSHVNGVDRNHAEDVIATGDDWGLVNLYGNPNNKGAKCKAYRAHSSHVVRVMFDKSDSYLYSVGGYDKTLMMWKVQ